MNHPDNNFTDDYALDRIQAVPALIGRHEDFLIVTGWRAPPGTWRH